MKNLYTIIASVVLAVPMAHAVSVTNVLVQNDGRTIASAEMNGLSIYTNTVEFADPYVGCIFDVEIIYEALGSNAIFRPFSGANDHSLGIDSDLSGNDAINITNEGVRFAIGSIVPGEGITNTAVATFSGFSGIHIYYADSDDDAGALLDGTTTNEFWSWDGAITNSTSITNSTDPTVYIFTNEASRARSMVDFASLATPTVLEASWRTNSVAGPNRWRVNTLSAILDVSGPFSGDYDGDGLTNADEVDNYGTNWRNADSDGDSYSDGEEVILHGTDPSDPDSIPADLDLDGDGVSNGDELAYGTDPAKADTDGDGFDDKFEIDNDGLLGMISPTNPQAFLFDYVVEAKDTFGLFYTNELGVIAVGNLSAVMSNGTDLVMQLQPEKSNDGSSWTNAGASVEWTVPAGGTTKFYKVQGQ